MLGVWAGKLTILMLRLANRNATSLPGKVALRVSPNLLRRLGRKLERCIVITGTNGKTTTNALVTGMFSVEQRILTNAEGANMTQGIVTALLRGTSWFGRLKSRTAVFEVDEATLPLIASALPIKVVAINNVFRDQLDRYGEVDGAIQKLKQGLRQTHALVVANGDDPLARHIALTHAGRSVYFGLAEQHAAVTDRYAPRDGAFCLSCGAPLIYDGVFYGQLGLYHCSGCDFYRPVPDYTGAYRGRDLTVTQKGLPPVTFRLPVRGVFNIYNALCAIAVARACGLSADAIVAGLAQFESPLGRMQTYETTPESVLNLIKNPTGCDTVLQTLATEAGGQVMCIAINDLAADGRDVSWLWDADFELVPDTLVPAHIVVSGYRAEDMALRLKYAGYPPTHIDIVPDLAQAVDQSLTVARELGLTVQILTTYTALYPMSEILTRRSQERVQQTAYRPSVS